MTDIINTLITLTGAGVRTVAPDSNCCFHCHNHHANLLHKERKVDKS